MGLEQNKPFKLHDLLDPPSKCYKSTPVVGPPSCGSNSLGDLHTVAVMRECRYPFRPSVTKVVCCGPCLATIPRACVHPRETNRAAPTEHIKSVGSPSSTAQYPLLGEPESGICSMTSTPPYFFSSSISGWKLSPLRP